MSCTNTSRIRATTYGDMAITCVPVQWRIYINFGLAHLPLLGLIFFIFMFLFCLIGWYPSNRGGFEEMLGRRCARLLGPWYVQFSGTNGQNNRFESRLRFWRHFGNPGSATAARRIGHGTDPWTKANFFVDLGTKESVKAIESGRLIQD